MPPRLLRRTVIDPLAVPVLLALAVVGAALALLGLPAALLDRRRRLLRLGRFAVVYLLVDLAVVVGCGWLWLISGLSAGRRPGAADGWWQRSHCGLLRWALGTVLAAATTTVGLRIEVSEPTGAAALSTGGPVLVLARHAGPGDSFVIAHLLLARYRRRPRIVLKQVLQWDPAMDVLLNRLGAYFVPSRSGAGDDLAGPLRDLAAGLRPDDALLIFPEGGNWTPRRRRRALRRLLRRGRHREHAVARALPHVLPPRPAGVLACLAGRPDLQVVLLAHAGLDRIVSPVDVWRAVPLGRPMRLAWWPVDGPAADGSAHRWLLAQWAAVNAWIEDAVSRPTAPEVGRR